MTATRARSYLYVPGDNAQMLAGAPGRGADALIVDLEDAVAPSAKDDALAVTRAFLATAAGMVDPGVELWVRTHDADLTGQLAAVVCPALTGIVLPKADVERASELDDALAVAEAAAGLQTGRTPVIGLVETARTLRRIDALAEAPRVIRLGMGEVDLRADLGVTVSEGEPELLFARSAVVTASAAAGLLAPVAPSSTDFRDVVALRASTERLVRLGFRARTAIHPAQVAVINDALTPTAERVAWAEQIIASFASATAQSRGAVVDHEGRMLDVAVVRSAQDILRRTGGDRGRA
ncbi:HpcH/HpaI aldolase/citrate lyase family protein [Rhizomonospora bruguierae]|uniref:HpcH/HpaI aldolase/citrate lyase family protein n=1 Tax=Rhizomonospora bruguierae TaxID=1581705 RepID=UPI001BCB76B8|nr:CoA ester lyase [Micromonospora sp. NBRC 107566]